MSPLGGENEKEIRRRYLHFYLVDLGTITGKLFIDYFLDGESMKIMAKLGGEFVNGKGIYLPLPDADIQFVPMDKFDIKAYAEKKK